jgi:protein mago nashi
VFVSSAVVDEMKRIIKDSEIVKSVTSSMSTRAETDTPREDDKVWPKKNIGGRQELEVRIERDHISFEVS